MWWPDIGLRPSLKGFIAGEAGWCYVLYIFWNTSIKMQWNLGFLTLYLGVPVTLASGLFSPCLPWDWERFGIPMRKAEHKKKRTRHALILKSRISLSSFSLVCPGTWNGFWLEGKKPEGFSTNSLLLDAEKTDANSARTGVCSKHGQQKSPTACVHYAAYIV